MLNKEDLKRIMCEIILPIVGVMAILFAAAKYMPSAHDSSDNTRDTKYQYGQEVSIKKGFYRDYTCVVLQEYKSSIFCKLYRVADENHQYVHVMESYQSNVNIELSNTQDAPLYPQEDAK